MFFRIVSAALLLPGFVWLMFWERRAWFQGLVVLATCLAWLEFRAMAARQGSRPSALLGLPFVAGYLLLSLDIGLREGALHDPLSGVREMLIIGFVAAVALRFVVMENLQSGVRDLMAELAGGIYIAVFSSFILRLHVLPQGARWVLMVFALAWIYDSGAYFTGKSIGKRPFSAWSPHKTWEGFFGGLAAAGIAAPLLARHLLGLQAVPLWQLVALGIAAGAMGQLGDLLESMFKRWAGVKDSSGGLGPHGGFLDKIDSSMFVAPLVYSAALWYLVP
jgi:phosphatidate cytidylyltransferase